MATAINNAAHADRTEYPRLTNANAQGKEFTNELRTRERAPEAAARQVSIGGVAAVEAGADTLPEVANNGAGAARDLTHRWTQNANGLYETNANLSGEWQQYYTMMQNGEQNRLTPIQRLEGNAQAVFVNSGLKTASAADLSRDRQDLQREFDAVGAAMKSVDLDYAGEQPLTQNQYLEVSNVLQNSPALETLAIQGHGLNNPTNTNFNGYTEDFQNNSGSNTTYIGGGDNNGNNAVADLIDDDIISHALFPAVDENGQLEQLNQNGAAEGTVTKELAGWNNMAFTQVLKPTDFQG